MKNSISGAWLLAIVLVFMSVFIAYICISINYSHVFKLKTSIVTTIEEYGGLNSTTLSKIDALMRAGNYRAKAQCEESTTDRPAIGITDDYADKSPDKKKFNVCIYREHRRVGSNNNDKYYYTVEVFLDFQLPIIGDLYDFRVSGETNAIYYPTDSYFTN